MLLTPQSPYTSKFCHYKINKCYETNLEPAIEKSETAVFGRVDSEILVKEKKETFGNFGMASEVAREVADNIIGGSFGELNILPETLLEDISTVTLTKECSGYSLADDRSQFSQDIDRWMGIKSPTENAAVQGIRAPTMVQRSALTDLPSGPSISDSGIWYLLAMVLPLFSLNTNYTSLRCSASLVLHSAEVMIGQTVSRLKQHLRALAQDQVLRELFAAVLDVILVIYALGFLVLSLYQASIFG